MAFSDVLDSYLAALGCTALDLSRAAGIAPSTVSRYLSGERVPRADGEPLAKLAAGIASLAAEQDAAAPKPAASTFGSTEWPPDTQAVLGRLSAEATAPAP